MSAGSYSAGDAMADKYAAECFERFQKLPVEDWQPAGEAREHEQGERS